MKLKPPTREELASFLEARKEWSKHNKPFRPIQEINHIYNDICKTCEFFKKDRCTACGCRIKKNEISGFNKLAMATTSCPKGKWGPNIPSQDSQDSSE